MDKLSAFLLCLTLPASVVQAVGVNDNCSKIPGHWQGIYTLKTQADCSVYNGCTHLVMAEASYAGGNKFRIKLNPAVGQGGVFEIHCEDGNISSPVNPGNSVSLSCDESNHCFVVYDDERLSSEMAKQ
ncbi:hypothetical protein Lbir_2586 [Legionella birminghamensis]|uniref:Secreted protein n=1 Tax=Legionella birminghamensis TaxID=28083 RepID=A0A378I7X0_9GAMM|nr:hypothetical protein [Legionella birminghamensis]KTC67984.1 hypothetical protein Lbir_2586 [Legionella birminghamensis]STX31307.1 Uncharacterised protein [Legionella birminghamensis]